MLRLQQVLRITAAFVAPFYKNSADKFLIISSLGINPGYYPKKVGFDIWIRKSVSPPWKATLGPDTSYRVDTFFSYQYL